MPAAPRAASFATWPSEVDELQVSSTSLARDKVQILAADFKKLEHGGRLIDAGIPCFFGFGLEDGYVSTFWLLL